jgi:hypothetical protein
MDKLEDNKTLIEKKKDKRVARRLGYWPFGIFCHWHSSPINKSNFRAIRVRKMGNSAS